MTRDLILSVAVVVAVPAASAGLENVTDRLERAVETGDREAMQQCRVELEEAGELYSVAYAIWRESLLTNEDRKKRKKLLKEAQATLVSIVEEDPDNAEALSLLGGVYGSQITGGWSGMTLGPKSGKVLKRAEEAAPDNPRVLFQVGVSAFRSPKSFGGSLERAEDYLRRAARVFEGRTEPQPWPNWGRVDVQAFLGLVLAKRGDYDGARKAYEKGLTIAPENAWIRQRLLPRLDELEADAGNGSNDD